jgi:hypothetical protein
LVADRAADAEFFALPAVRAEVTRIAALGAAGARRVVGAAVSAVFTLIAAPFVAVTADRGTQVAGGLADENDVVDRSVAAVVGHQHSPVTGDSACDIDFHLHDRLVVYGGGKRHFYKGIPQFAGVALYGHPLKRGGYRCP